MRHILTALLTASLFATPTAFAQANKPAPAKATAPEASPAAEAAWKELEKALWLPPAPPEWSKKEPSEEELAKFKAQRAELLEKAAEKAQHLYARFPEHPKAGDAHRIELQALQLAVNGGRTNLLGRLETVENATLASPGLDADERFSIRYTQAERRAALLMRENKALGWAELEKGMREVAKEFPQRAEGWRMLLMAATKSEPAKAKEIASLVLKDAKAEGSKEEAKSLLTQLGFHGKPLPLQFTAADGRAVDLQKMKGKVVLVDFWATWCGPCIAALPEVKTTYQKLHPKGFEMIGISLDESKEQLLQFAKAQDMPWPHYFDGKRWQNVLARKFGITGIPAMWLVDKKGVLRDLSAGEDLADKVEKLLAEKE